LLRLRPKMNAITENAPRVGAGPSGTDLQAEIDQTIKKKVLRCRLGDGRLDQNTGHKRAPARRRRRVPAGASERAHSQAAPPVSAPNMALARCTR